MNLLIASLTMGFILSLLALGIFISFRVFDHPDMTGDGSIALGASIAAVCIARGRDPLLATALGTAAGALAGTVTGLLHTRFGIPKLLAGILMMTALYSVNLQVMGKSNVPLISETTLVTWAESAGRRMAGEENVWIAGWETQVRDVASLVASAVIVIGVALVLYWFFATDLGSALRATGNNAQMVRALGVDTDRALILGLTLSNALVALSGALLAQYQGFADVQMGIGMVVWGLASVIIGESLVGKDHLGLTIAGAMLGSLLFRLLVAIALRWGMDPNNLKLVTAVFVFVAMVAPRLLSRDPEAGRA